MAYGIQTWGESAMEQIGKPLEWEISLNVNEVDFDNSVLLLGLNINKNTLSTAEAWLNFPTITDKCLKFEIWIVVL